MIFSTRRFLAAAALGAALASSAALAAEGDSPSARIERFGQRIQRFGQNIGQRLDVTQLFDRQPRELEEEPASGGPHDAGAASVRIDRLENQVRALNGQVEELQHKIVRLEDQLRRTQESPATPPGAPRAVGLPSEPPTSVPPPGSSLRRGDAFDPGRDPNAPGAPRPLGATPPSAPLPAGPAPAANDLRSPGAPLDLTRGLTTSEAAALPTIPATPPAQTAAVSPVPSPPQSPRDEFDVALARLRQGEYETAEKGFSGFLARNGKSKLAPQAIFYLGESYFLRERHREAAEKYLEISTKYPGSPQAPEAMLRLGQSLNAIGAKEQACASFNEIPVKFPSAPTRLKEAAQNESKKDRC
jgi:tol-pal system protein YbgF